MFISSVDDMIHINSHVQYSFCNVNASRSVLNNPPCGLNLREAAVTSKNLRKGSFLRSYSQKEISGALA